MQAELHFTVTVDEDGNYCAEAHLPQGDLFTDAASLDGLLEALNGLIALYCKDTGEAVSGFTLRFASRQPLAA